MEKLSYKEKIKNFKNKIKNSNYDKHKSFDRYEPSKLIGTLYVKEKMNYGFHIYYIHEPSEHNQLAGKNGTVSEMYYDLRNQKYWIKRNMKDVKFSVRNVDSIFPRNKNERTDVFDKLSTEANRSLYESAFHYLGAMGEEKLEMFGRFFYRLMTEHSYYELLHKARVKINLNTTIVNPKGKSPKEILGLSKTQWKLVSKFKCNPSYFAYLNNEEADKKAINYLSYIQSLEDEFGIDKLKEFQSNELNHIYQNGYAHRSALKIAERYNLPMKKFIKYIYFECDVSQGLRTYDAIGEYGDYIRMATEMGYERFDRYPKFLRTAHDIASRNYNIQLDEIELKQWEDSIKNHSIFESTYRGYKILTPKTPDDLIREGNILSHCVGSYINKVRKGVSTILFLRETKDLDYPLVTIEVKDNRITEARGKMNNPPSPEQKEAIKKFADKYQLAI